MPGSAVVKHDHSRVTACACHASSRTTRTDDTGRLPFITCVVIVGRVLQSFRDRDTERVWRRQRSKRFDQPTQRAALRKLFILDAADQIGDLRVPRRSNEHTSELQSLIRNSYAVFCLNKHRLSTSSSYTIFHHDN